MVRVLFIHPDLGIGGAERLVVDAALALKAKGKVVSFLTAHHDKKHCFPETKNGTFSVTVVGDWLPRSIFGYCYAACAYLRMVYLALYLVFMSSLKPDMIFCDQISACIPVLRWGTKAKIVFYCHFPDQLLTQRNTFLKSVYRKPIDWLEEKSTGLAHVLLVNSHFTAGVFRETFKSLDNMETHVLYPTLNTSEFDAALALPNMQTGIKESFPSDARFVFSSINRFERKKNLPLAIHALDYLRQLLSDDEWTGVYLAMAGGYDLRVQENVEHLQELRRLAERLDLSGRVFFHKSISNADKINLLKLSIALIYTPSNEHFGIVPIEAMYMKTPVIAMNSGGPLETIEDNKTGYLTDPNPEDVAKAMAGFIRDFEVSVTMGNAGQKRVKEHFSFDAFADNLNGICDSLLP